jgi:hypothetical protein
MKVKYPVSSGQVQNLPDELLALKIARHSPCSACNTCSGLHPPLGVEVVQDETDDLESDDEEPAHSYLDSCACGHSVPDHNALKSDIGQEEFARRSRVAFRLDEVLQVCLLQTFRVRPNVYLAGISISNLRLNLSAYVSLCITYRTPEGYPISPGLTKISLAYACR